MRAVPFPVEVRIGGFAVIDEQSRADAAYLLHAMRKTRVGCQVLLPIEIGWAADRVKAFSNGRDGSESILRIVIATESGDACGSTEPHGKSRGVAADQPAIIQAISGHDGPPDADRGDWAGRGAPLKDFEAVVVFDADNSDFGTGNQPLLHVGVVFNGAVAVDVVGGDVQEYAHGGLQRRRQVDLERRHLNDVETNVFVLALQARPRRADGRLQRQDGAADVTAHLHVVAGLAQDVGNKRRRRRFAVGAGDGDKGRIGAMRDALAGERSRCRQ